MNFLQAPLGRRQFFTRVLGLAGAWMVKAERTAAAEDLPFVGEIRMFAGGYAPRGWMFCEGQILPVAGNETLFALIGTTYGSGGPSTFALPDLRGRAPVHSGNGWALGERRGVEAVALTVDQMPAHTHSAGGSSSPGDGVSPAGMVPARDAAGTLHFGSGSNVTMAPGSLLATGGAGAHDNLQPYLGIHFIVSLLGMDPRTP